MLPTIIFFIALLFSVSILLNRISMIFRFIALRTTQKAKTFDIVIFYIAIISWTILYYLSH